MSKLLSTIDILTDTWQTVITRVNSLIDSLSAEIITANSTTAETGSIVSPRHARLFGQFWANSFATNANNFVVNNTIMTFGNQFKIQANNSVGTANYVLTSGGSTGNLYWSPAGGSGTVKSVANGIGLNGGTISTSGTLSVKAGTGIIVDTNGVSVDTTSLGTVRSVANGTGLTGGTITSTGTLSVKAGSGIIVNSTGVSVDMTSIGTVKSVANGAGLNGGTINTSGTLSVKAGSGIIVDASGVSVDTTNLGTVKSVANGVGLTGGTINTTGTLAVKAGTGILVNASGVTVTNPTLRHVTSGFTSGGQVFVQTAQPTAAANGDIWIQI